MRWTSSGAERDRDNAKRDHKAAESKHGRDSREELEAAARVVEAQEKVDREAAAAAEHRRRRRS